LVGISGALAMENSDEDDDIDLFIITSAGRLWLSRFLVTILVELVGQRRRPNHEFKRMKNESKLIKSVGISQKSAGISNIKDKICLNMFVDESHLAIPERERNLFTAHEVAQMKRLWDKDEAYDRFLVANSWVGEYLPSAIGNAKLQFKIKKEKSPTHLLIYLSNYLEKLLCVLQIKYMAKRRTIEKIESGRILFHPDDKSEWAIDKFKYQIAKIKI